jgi:exopolysaccharide production protein ExoQ
MEDGIHKMPHRIGQKMKQDGIQLKFDGIAIALVLILANVRALMFFTLYPEASTLLSPAWIEIYFWLLAALGILYFLIRYHHVNKYLLAWQRNWLIGLFVLLALISSFWSLSFAVSLFRALELLLATLIAAYVGIRYRPDQLLEILFWFGAIVLILSITLVFAAPKTGTMYWAPHYGSWRGIYWYKNHLSSITALVSIVFFCRGISAIERRDKVGYLDGFFYFLSVVVLYFAESVTGNILFLVLHFSVICIWLWIKMSHYLRPWHYYAIFAAFLTTLTWMSLNLDKVLAIFNRSPTLTGRVDLWNYLLKDIIPQRLWWGHGFGAIWTFESFREATREKIGWGSQVLIADNGFLDILLHVGVIGFVIFVSILILACVRTFRYGILHKSLISFFPLLIMIFVLVGNIAFSLFAETEVFVWLLIVTALFIATPLPDQRGYAIQKEAYSTPQYVKPISS